MGLSGAIAGIVLGQQCDVGLSGEIAGIVLCQQCAVGLSGAIAGIVLVSNVMRALVEQSLEQS